MHLREHGVAVYGFGDSKTPAPFQSACTRFLVLDRLSAPSGQADATDATDTTDVADSTDEATTEATSTRSPRRATKKATTAGKATVATVADDDADAPRRTASKATKAAKAPAKATRASAKNGNPPPERATRAQLRGDNRLVALLRRAVESAADDSGWAKIGTVGQRISNQSSFDSRNYGYAKLSKLIEASELFEIRDAGSPDMAVRDPRAG
ncbi:OST-HTH/LOTUS domain-containing protein [Phycicoccus sp. MAQZ13P-2]|nr:OST-HTH/LOTUS domain-containing protein [Phycicoccus mangrovi]MBT9274048.1 OST-HTH/LOTUS domain-containing protein [Phycicoccus mangrovi]